MKTEKTALDVKQFSHHDPDYMNEPFEFYRSLREKCPVAHTEEHDGVWLLSRYEDVFPALLDYKTYSSADGTAIPRQKIFPMYPIDQDPPEQVALRKVLNPLFEGKYIRSLEEDIRTATHQLIDSFIEAGECDIASQLCRELPPIIALKLIGVGDDASDMMRRCIYTMTHVRGTDIEAADKAGDELAMYLFQLIQGRRQSEPQDDVMSVLMDAEINGSKLDDEYILRTLAILLFGGLDTSTAVMIQALYHLSEHPEEKERLLAGPDLWDSAVEEFVRFTSPVQGLKRQLKQPVHLYGKDMPEGDDVWLMFASANRDEEKFPQADKCILDRSPNKHVAFGAGAHKCIGLHLGRAFVKILLQIVLDRLPDYKVVEGFEPDYAVGETRGIVSLPVTFTPGEKKF